MYCNLYFRFEYRFSKDREPETGEYFRNCQDAAGLLGNLAKAAPTTNQPRLSCLCPPPRGCWSLEFASGGRRGSSGFAPLTVETGQASMVARWVM